MIEQGGRGGVADYTVELVRALAQEGWSVTLATADDHLYPPIDGVVVRPVFHYLRDATALGRLVRSHGLGRAVNGLLFVLALPRLMLLARRARTDIVHTQGWEIPQIGLVALLCLRLAGATVVQTSHGTFERSRTFPRVRRLARLTSARLTARTIVHTQADLARIPGEVRSRAVVIPHGEYGGLARSGGDAEREASRAGLGIGAQTPVTLVFGQLRADKGLGEVIQAMRRLPSLHLLIGGKDAGGLAAVAAQLQEPGLAERVTLREGFLEMREVAPLFAATDTVVLPYEAASQSGVLLLAYGFGRPVIVYPSGGLPEAVIDGQTGWLCSRPDVDALVDALAHSIDAGWAECSRRGEAGARLAGERFAWPAIAHRTAELYAQALGHV
ncbi:MAG: glycosyltransferase family 4 protein [Solirubrobacteraceae bacterium]